MKGLAVAVLLAVVVFGAAIGPDAPGTVANVPAGSQPGGLGVEPDEDGLPPRIEYPGDLAYSCDEADRAFGVEPDEPRAWEAAERGCLRGRLATERAPWPDGVHPAPLP